MNYLSPKSVVEVRPLNGVSFEATLLVAKPSVLEAKEEIARLHGTEEYRQELYKVSSGEQKHMAAVSLADAAMLENGDVVAMVVKEAWLWRAHNKKHVMLSEYGAVATAIAGGFHSPQRTLVTSTSKLSSGQHYWEVEVVSLTTIGNDALGERAPVAWVGISRQNYALGSHNDGWFIDLLHGGLFGNGQEGGMLQKDAHVYDASEGLTVLPGGYDAGDRVGVALNLDEGSLQFFKNGIKHGPGYPAGSVTGTVTPAVQFHVGSSARGEKSRGEKSLRLLPNAKAFRHYQRRLRNLPDR
jgi:hypothetical protein